MTAVTTPRKSGILTIVILGAFAISLFHTFLRFDYCQRERLFEEGRLASQRLSYAEAEQALSAGLQTRTHDSLFARTERLLACVYIDQHRVAEAEPLLKQAIEILSKQPCDGNHKCAHCVDSAEVVNNLAYAYGRQERYAEAEATYKQALHLRETLYGEGSIETAETKMLLGVTYLDEHRYADAEPVLKSAFNTYEMTYTHRGPDYSGGISPIVFSAYELKQIYQEQGRQLEAENILARMERLKDEYPGLGEEMNTLSM